MSTVDRFRVGFLDLRPQQLTISFFIYDHFQSRWFSKYIDNLFIIFYTYNTFSDA
jgi:hypothetical protein